MFCSQFVIACFQAAVVDRALTLNSQLNAEQVGRIMPTGLQLNASASSPLKFGAKLTTYTEEWSPVLNGVLLVRPQQDLSAASRSHTPTPSISHSPSPSPSPSISRSPSPSPSPSL